MSAWDCWCADAWKDDWAELCDRLGIAYDDLLDGDEDIDSRELRKRVSAWAYEHDAWVRVEREIGRL